MTRSDKDAPAASRAIAVAVAFSPTSNDRLAGETMTVATGTRIIVIVAVPVTPSLLTLISADPAATAVTNPASETVATVVLLEPQVVARSVRTFPAAS